MLEIKNLCYGYSSKTEFAFDLIAKDGDMIVITGESGIGKTTLLHLIAGFLTPFSGQILWNGQDISPLPPSQRPLSMIFQDDNLFEHLNLWSNIALGISPSLKLSEEEKHRLEGAMDDLGIADLAARTPSQVSGGQQQRAALARALVRAAAGGKSGGAAGKSLLLFDEPFSALDTETREDCIAAIKTVMAKGSMTAIMVSHNPADAVSLGGRVLSLHRSPPNDIVRFR